MLNGFCWLDEDISLIMDVFVYNTDGFGGFWELRLRGLRYVIEEEYRRGVLDCQDKTQVSYRHDRKKIDDSGKHTTCSSDTLKASL